MAQKRMFAKTIIDSDAFLDMSSSTQNLYFHLGMRADDDGFINNPKMIMRIINSSEDDMKVLILKKFILPLNNGIIVIKHWKINNYIQIDRYTPTKYQEELNKLELDENKAYTFKTKCIQSVYNSDTQVSKDKISLDKISKDNKNVHDEFKNNDNISVTLHNEPSLISNSSIIIKPKEDNNILDYFNTFWKAYPKKMSKGQAEKTFKKLKVDSELLEKMLSAIELQKDTKNWREENGKYIPYPSTWLNAKGWENEVQAKDRKKIVDDYMLKNYKETGELM